MINQIRIRGGAGRYCEIQIGHSGCPIRIFLQPHVVRRASAGCLAGLGMGDFFVRAALDRAAVVVEALVAAGLTGVFGLPTRTVDSRLAFDRAVTLVEAVDFRGAGFFASAITPFAVARRFLTVGVATAFGVVSVNCEAMI